jgi:hypothetical protein
MKKFLLIILVLSLFTIEINCSGSHSGSKSEAISGTSFVKITIGNSDTTKTSRLSSKGFAPDVGILAIPSNVYKLVFTIAAPDMPTIVKEVIVAGQSSITETFDVPNGNNRYFLVEAKNASGIVLYRGSITANLTGEPVSLTIFMTALDVTPPTVIANSPATDATGVPVTSPVIITFSESIDCSTFNSATFTLKNNGTTVGGTVSCNGAVITVTPLSNLEDNTTYTATITTGVKDLAGNAMASNYIWSFTTGQAPDTTPPTVISVSPANGATDVSISTTVTATFSEAMDPSTINTTTFTLSNGGPVSGTVTYTNTTATFTPSSPLAANTVYTATITTGVKDLAGNTMAANYIWDFATGTPDTTLPTVISVTPVNGASGVADDTTVTATFSEAMDPSTINTSTFTLNSNISASILGKGLSSSAVISGTVTYNDTTATFTPLSPLALNAIYTATITTGVKDLSGNAMAANYIWTFDTSTGLPDLEPTTVALGSSPDYISYTVVNNGTAGATNVTVYVEMYDYYENYDCFSRTITVPAGSKVIDSIDTPFFPTDYRIIVDPNNAISESDETNNCISSHPMECGFALPDTCVSCVPLGGVCETTSECCTGVCFGSICSIVG